MSQDDTKISHSRRLWQKVTHIARQMSIRNAHGFPPRSVDEGVEVPHRYHKVSGMTCGDPKCAMCGNPRKFFKEPTMQEKRQQQDVDNTRAKRSNGVTPSDE